MSDKMVVRMRVRKEADVVRGRSGKRVCNSLYACRQEIDKMSEGRWVGYVTEGMTFLFLSMTRFWIKDLRISGDKTG